MTKAPVRLRDQLKGLRPCVPTDPGTLPTWFGIPQSVEEYVAVADRRPTIVASLEGEDVGFLTVLRHSSYSAEIYVMGVLPEHHHQGIGRRMVEHAEDSLARTASSFCK